MTYISWLPSRSLAKTIWLPSGDQDGIAVGGGAVGDVGLTAAVGVHDPDLRRARRALETKAILVPSGDQAGVMSGPSSLVMAVWSVPSAFMTYTQKLAVAVRGEGDAGAVGRAGRRVIAAGAVRQVRVAGAVGADDVDLVVAVSTGPSVSKAMTPASGLRRLSLSPPQESGETRARPRERAAARARSRNRGCRRQYANLTRSRST